MYQTRQENEWVEDLSGKGNVSESVRTSKKQKSQFFSGQEKSRKIEKGTYVTILVYNLFMLG